MKRYTPHFGPDQATGVRSLCQPGGEKSTWTDGTKPVDGTAGYERNCIHQQKSATGAFLNDGTATSADFNRIATLTDNVALVASGTELNNNNYAAGRIVTSTGTQLTVTAALHEGKDVLLDNTHTVTVTLPAATGSGGRYNFIVLTLGTDGSKLVTCANTTDIIFGGSIAVNTQSTTLGFQTTNATTVTFNNTTTGGKIGSKIELTDVAAGKFSSRVFAITSGNPATPFS